MITVQHRMTPMRSLGTDHLIALGGGGGGGGVAGGEREGEGSCVFTSGELFIFFFQ